MPRTGAYWAGEKTEVVLRVASSERCARSAAPCCIGEGLACGASCVPIKKGRVTKRSASDYIEHRSGTQPQAMRGAPGDTQLLQEILLCIWTSA